VYNIIICCDKKYNSIENINIRYKQKKNRILEFRYLCGAESMLKGYPVFSGNILQHSHVYLKLFDNLNMTKPNHNIYDINCSLRLNLHTYVAIPYRGA